MVKSSPGKTEPRTLASLTAARMGMRSNFSTPSSSHPEACAIDSIKSTPGISGWPGKCPSKMVFVSGTCASTRIVFSSKLRSRMRSTSWKYSSCMAGGSGTRALCGDQFVDARTKVLQDEILLGGRLAVVDFLGPFLQRQFDAERLVDGKCDVQKIEAVDAQIVNGVAIRRDRVARNVAGFSDDRGDLIEC